jgi:predicted O-methyltransferase YrrM
MNISFVKDYVKHRLTAKKQKSLNSPFVNQLAAEVIYDDTQHPVYNQIERHKRGLLPNSRRMGNRPKADQLLYRLALHLKPKLVVEIGTGMGISKQYLMRALPNAIITSLEHDASLKHVSNKLYNIDMAFINYYNPAELLSAFEMLLPKLSAKGVLVICNVYGSPLAKQAFRAIQVHPRVSATVDLFWLQLVFFNDNVDKEHFRLRL